MKIFWKDYYAEGFSQLVDGILHMSHYLMIIIIFLFPSKLNKLHINITII